MISAASAPITSQGRADRPARGRGADWSSVVAVMIGTLGRRRAFGEFSACAAASR